MQQQQELSSPTALAQPTLPQHLNQDIYAHKNGYWWAVAFIVCIWIGEIHTSIPIAFFAFAGWLLGTNANKLRKACKAREKYLEQVKKELEEDCRSSPRSIQRLVRINDEGLCSLSYWLQTMDLEEPYLITMCVKVVNHDLAADVARNPTAYGFVPDTIELVEHCNADSESLIPSFTSVHLVRRC